MEHAFYKTVCQYVSEALKTYQLPDKEIVLLGIYPKKFIDNAQRYTFENVYGSILEAPRGIGWRGRWEGGSGWGIHVNPWLIHVNV